MSRPRRLPGPALAFSQG